MQSEIHSTEHTIPFASDGICRRLFTTQVCTTGMCYYLLIESQTNSQPLISQRLLTPCHWWIKVLHPPQFFCQIRRRKRIQPIWNTTLIYEMLTMPFEICSLKWHFKLHWTHRYHIFSKLKVYAGWYSCLSVFEVDLSDSNRDLSYLCVIDLYVIETFLLLNVPMVQDSFGDKTYFTISVHGCKHNWTFFLLVIDVMIELTEVM